jgi:hypothetical protein
MTFSNLEPTRKGSRHLVCPHCGSFVPLSYRSSFVENGLRALACLVLALILVPLAVIVWKSCSEFLSDRISHSIFYHPLEDWSR